MKYIYTIMTLIAILTGSPPTEAKSNCMPTNTMCLLTELQETVPTITETKWRDPIYREMAKLLTHAKETEKAIALLELIDNPDTKAMTIRGIGMAAAEHKDIFTMEEYQNLFIRLTSEAAKIEHPPSYAIALTYISMAQAMAGNDDGATKTALTMKNAALRNKAFAENAEIQAERGAITQALESITYIDDAAFRDKAHGLIAKIFVRDDVYDKALKAIDAMTSPYQKAKSLLYLVAQQITPDDAGKTK